MASGSSSSTLLMPGSVAPNGRQLGIALVRLVVAGDRLDHAGFHRLAQAVAVGGCAAAVARDTGWRNRSAPRRWISWYSATSA
jgi:hypothetical protein